MNYQKFPFGKYKGVYIPELPLNYVVYALTAMSLPEELNNALREG
jgi:uncharacterized protein (DUF3820 family)